MRIQIETVRAAVETLESKGLKVTVKAVQSITGGNTAKVTALLRQVREDRGTNPPALARQPEQMGSAERRQAILSLLEAEFPPVEPWDEDATEVERMGAALTLSTQLRAELEEQHERLKGRVFYSAPNRRVVPLHAMEPYYEGGALVTPKRARLTVFLGVGEHEDVDDLVSDITLSWPAVQWLQHLAATTPDLQSKFPEVCAWIAQLTEPPKTERDRRG